MGTGQGVAGFYARLESMGYKIAVYPLTPLNAAIHAMRDTLRRIAELVEAAPAPVGAKPAQKPKGRSRRAKSV